MNNARRKRLNEARCLIDQAKEIIEGAQGEEQEALDNMPEGIQSGEGGEKAQETIDTLVRKRRRRAGACVWGTQT